MRRPVRHYCLPNILCLALATLLFGSSILEARAGISGVTPPGQSGSEPKPTLKERILEIPPGAMIEVRLLNKKKIRGRLGEITDEGFSLQTAQGNKIETQKLTFSELKSVKKVEPGKHVKPIGWIAIGALAAVGAAVLITIAVAASGD
jgi:hypothetical protein